ncbi:hypothetical protein ACFW04_013205 [Cataglyphis niger]
MVEQGICRSSSITRMTPFHMVPKNEQNSWRLCRNYRVLNATTISDRYLLPHIQDFTAGLHTYYQVPVAKKDIPKTAVTTLFGLFEFLDLIFYYLDDILIASVDEKEHSKHLHTVFNHFKQFGMTINSSKCLFGKHEILFLDYLVSKQEIKPTSEKVKAIIDYKKTKTVHELRRFIGIINFYRRCLKEGSSPVLTEYLKDSRKRDGRLITWIPEADETFKNYKEELLRVTTLAHPALNASLIPTCDDQILQYMLEGHQILIRAHISGKQNIVADFLLRIESISMSMIVSLKELAELQKEDEELKILLTNSSLKLRKLIRTGSTTFIFCDCSTVNIHPYVPQLLRRRIFDVVHGLPHPSISQWARFCLLCQRVKVQKHTKNLPQKIIILDQCFQHIHLDLIGPLLIYLPSDPEIFIEKHKIYMREIKSRSTRWEVTRHRRAFPSAGRSRSTREPLLHIPVTIAKTSAVRYNARDSPLLRRGNPHE